MTTYIFTGEKPRCPKCKVQHGYWLIGVVSWLCEQCQAEEVAKELIESFIKPYIEMPTAGNKVNLPPTMRNA